MTAYQAFDAVYHGDPNFMTPQVENRYTRQCGEIQYHIELSSGRGIDNHPIFGVTVLEESPVGELSRSKHNRGCFESLDAAREYADSLIIA